MHWTNAQGHIKYVHFCVTNILVPKLLTIEDVLEQFTQKLQFRLKFSGTFSGVFLFIYLFKLELDDYLTLLSPSMEKYSLNILQNFCF